MRLGKAFSGLRLHEQRANVWAQLSYAVFEVSHEGFDLRDAERIIELEAQ